MNALPIRPLRVVIKTVYFFSQPALALGYLAGLLLLWRLLSWRKLLAFFAPLGRTALSQYLLQSLVCSLVFCGFGLGLYGKLPLSACIVGAVALFAGQAWLSRFWLRYFRMGPVEWLWRSLSYRRRPALRQPRPAYPAPHSLGERK